MHMAVYNFFTLFEFSNVMRKMIVFCNNIKTLSYPGYLSKKIHKNISGLHHRILLFIAGVSRPSDVGSVWKKEKRTEEKKKRELD